MLNNPWPLYIVVPWITIILTLGLGYLYLRFKDGRTTIYGDLTMESDESPAKNSSDEDISTKKEEYLTEKLKAQEKKKEKKLKNK